MIATYYKDPDAEIAYSIDWSAFLGTAEIATSTWTVTPTGELAIGNSTNDPTQTTVRLTGGNPGTRYKVTNRVTTNAGEIDEESLSILVTQK